MIAVIDTMSHQSYDEATDVVILSACISMLVSASYTLLCLQVGINVLLHHVPQSVSQADLVSIVRQTCADTTIDGLLVQVSKIIIQHIVAWHA